MKGLELNVTKQNGMTLVEYQLGVADVYDDRVSDKVAQLGNIIPFQYKDEDGKRSIVSYVHHDTSLEVMLRQTLKKADVLAILKGLLCAFEIGAAGVQICYLVRDLNYIYVDPESKAVKCIMVPVKQDPLGQSDIPDFFRNIVSHMRFDEADKDDYVARILTLINTDHYSNMKLKGLVDAEMEKLGLFYTRDEGLKKEADTTPAPEVQNQNVKVNRVGVMNNMRPQGMPAMGQPMGQPVPPMGGQPMMQPQQPQMHQPQKQQQQQQNYAQAGMLRASFARLDGGSKWLCGFLKEQEDKLHRAEKYLQEHSPLLPMFEQSQSIITGLKSALDAQTRIGTYNAHLERLAAQQPVKVKERTDTEAARTRKEQENHTLQNEINLRNKQLETMDRPALQDKKNKLDAGRENLLQALSALSLLAETERTLNEAKENEKALNA